MAETNENEDKIRETRTKKTERKTLRDKKKKYARRERVGQWDRERERVTDSKTVWEGKKERKMRGV